MSPQLEVQLIALVTALACALPGVFLLLRRQALMSDAIGHSVLPGIVVAFFLVGSLDSPLLMLGAALSGLLMVLLVDLLKRTGRVDSDAALGLVFPAMFSLGVLMISTGAGHIHLDTDAVLLGELAFAPFNRLEMGGKDLGPVALWQMSGILLLNLGFLLLVGKERLLCAFDPVQADVTGFRPSLIQILELGLVSLTCVGAFDAVGSVLVVALMIVPAACARLLSDRPSVLLVWSLLIAALAALGGWYLALWLDASIAGSMATLVGAIFLLLLFFTPGRGLLPGLLASKARRRLFARRMLSIHLLHHQHTEKEEEECRLSHLSEHLSWSPEEAGRIVAWSEEQGEISRKGDRLYLLNKGRRLALEALEQLPLQSRTGIA